NNLHQIGVAFHSHHDAHQCFPSGGYLSNYPPLYVDGNGRPSVNGQPAIAGTQWGSWAFQLLPYLEAKNTWTAGPIVAIGPPQPMFFCPSRRGPQTLQLEDGEEGYVDPPPVGVGYNPQLSNGPLGMPHALCDYAASNLEGTGAVRQLLPVRILEIT